MSTLDSVRVHSLTLSVPMYGAWRADLVLEGGDAPAEGTAVTLTAGDLALRGTVLRAAPDAPSKPHVVVAGGVGWDRVLERAPSYQSDVGVRLSTVLRDLAAGAGETIEQPSDVAIGQDFAAPSGVLYRDVLSALAQSGYVAPWRVDPDGVTRFGARVGSEVTARATVIRRNAGVGVAVLGIDSPAAFLSGNTLEGQTIERLVVNETSGKLEAEVWTTRPKAAPSMMTAILRKVAEFFPVLVYGFPRTYVVAAVRSDKRLDLIPRADAPHLPELAAVEQWNLGGALVTPPVGAEVAVVFRDANPTRPVAGPWSPASTPDEVSIDAAGEVNAAAALGAVIREGDTISITPGSGMGPVTGVVQVTLGLGVPPAKSRLKA